MSTIQANLWEFTELIVRQLDLPTSRFSFFTLFFFHSIPFTFHSLSSSLCGVCQIR